MRIISPYSEKPLPWRRGNLHAHTTLSDGRRDPQALIDQYAALGYDFLLISDHDLIVDPEKYDARGMTLIRGNEVTISGPHILHVDATTFVPPDADRQKVLDGIVADNGFAIVAHPNWEKHFNHCPQECLESWHGYGGVEIYNGLVRAHAGNPLATDRWDRLLGNGIRVWGFANDDAHFVGDEGVAWNVVQSESNRYADLLDAMRKGRFYASIGVTIESISVEWNEVRIETQDADRIVALGDFSQRLAHADGTSITYSLPGDSPCSYVRFECYGKGEAVAWTQPFFIER